MYNSVKQKKVQLSEDIFPVEAWELISNSREDNDVIIIDVSTPLLILSFFYFDHNV